MLSIAEQFKEQASLNTKCEQVLILTQLHQKSLRCKYECDISKLEYEALQKHGH